MKKILLLLLLSSTMAIAQWTDASKPALSISSATNLQSYIYSASDSLGNTFFLWNDFRDNRGDLYAQKLDARGVAQWGKDGLKIGNIVGNNSTFYSPKIVKPDQKGGALILWQQTFEITNDGNKNYIFGQYIAKDNKSQWTSGGVKLTQLETFSTNIYDTALDGGFVDGKIIVVFNIRNVGGFQDLYSKSINQANGLAVDNESKFFSGTMTDTQILYDSKNNQIISGFIQSNNFGLIRTESGKTFKGNPISCFQTNGATTRIDLFRLDKDGNVIIGRTTGTQVFGHKIMVDGKLAWGNSGINVGSNQAADLQIVPTSDGGGICTWIDKADKTHPFISAKIDATGKIIWQKDALIPQNGKSYFFPNKLVTDGKDGAYCAWFTQKTVGNDMIIQHVDKDGNLTFTDVGKPISPWTFYYDYKLLAHPKGGVIAYYAANNDAQDITNVNTNVYVNRFKEDGTQGFYNSLIIKDLAKKDYLAGDSLIVNFVSSGDGFSDNNAFFVKVLDSQGNFSDVTLPVVNSRIKIPANLGAGSYKLLLYSIDPVVSSENTIGFNVIKPTFKMEDLTKKEFCLAESFDVKLTTSSTFQADNVFKVLLSDAAGSFTKFIELGKDAKTTISVKIPTDLLGTNYKLKVTSTNPVLESINTLDLVVKKANIPVIIASKLTACVGVDSVSLTASCVGGTISWSNKLSGNIIKFLVVENQNYSATCSVVGCPLTAVSEVTAISAIPLPNATASNSGPYFEGDEIKLTSGGGGTYEWKGPNNFNSQTQNPTIPKAVLAATGVYSVKVTNNNCSKTATTDVKINPILANFKEDDTAINIYPNPTSQHIQVQFFAEIGKEVLINIFDQKGTIFLTKKIKAIGGKQTEVLDIQPLNDSKVTNGIYFLKVENSKFEGVKRILILR